MRECVVAAGAPSAARAGRDDGPWAAGALMHPRHAVSPCVFMLIASVLTRRVAGWEERIEAAGNDLHAGAQLPV